MEKLKIMHIKNIEATRPHHCGHWNGSCITAHADLIFGNSSPRLPMYVTVYAMHRGRSNVQLKINGHINCLEPVCKRKRPMNMTPSILMDNRHRHLDVPKRHNGAPRQTKQPFHRHLHSTSTRHSNCNSSRAKNCKVF